MRAKEIRNQDKIFERVLSGLHPYRPRFAPGGGGPPSGHPFKNFVLIENDFWIGWMEG